MAGSKLLHPGAHAGKGALREAAKWDAQAIQFLAGNFYGFVTKVASLAALLLIAVIIGRGLTEHVTVIEPISVPKALSESGYTPEVAGRRLRDALADFAKSANTSRKNPEIALPAELPNIVIPSVGISLDAVKASIRTVFNSTRSRSISGEIVEIQDKLWLRLRLDGQQIYSSEKGVERQKPDELLTAAAPRTVEEMQPYFFAAYLASQGRDDEAISKASQIIDRRPPTDEDVLWSYILKGNLLLKRQDYPAAKDALENAIKLNKDLCGPHNDLGDVHLSMKLNEKAEKEYREAIRLDPKDPRPHNGLAKALWSMGRNDEADQAFLTAQAFGRYASIPRSDRGDFLLSIGRKDEAMKEYGEAIKLGRETLKVYPKYTLARQYLGYDLQAVGKNEEAIKQYQTVLAEEPDNKTARRYLNDLMATGAAR